MSSGPGRAPVVVGVDDAGSAGAAVSWASAEAAARGCPLHVVHAVDPSAHAGPHAVGPPIGDHCATGTAAETVLRDAVDRARSVASDVVVSGLLLVGTPVRALLRESRGARLLVLGSRGLPVRSVSRSVAARAACPVVIIRPAPDGRDPGPDRTAPRIVVGVDAKASCAAAVGFAFEAARQRGVPLLAVHAWTPDLPADLEAVCGHPALAEARGRETLDRALERPGCTFADVPVCTELVRGDPARALLTASPGAALLVVGSRGRGRLLGALLGSVSQSVLRDVQRPLAVIPHDSERHQRIPGGVPRTRYVPEAGSAGDGEQAR